MNGEGEPLLPLGLFQDRNFALGNAGITVVGFSITAYPLASMIFYQVALGLTPTQSALLLIPMAVLTGALSPIVGKLIDRVNPRWFAVAGMLLFTLAISWTSVLMTPDTPVWMFLLPSAVQGLGMGCIFGPIANATTRNLASRQAGAGSGVFNTSRQIGSVLGAAAMAALIQARVVAESLGMVLKPKSPRPAELQFSPGARWSECRRRTGQAGAPGPQPRYC
ncbi:MFS transporter [Pseudarthrobacter sp. NBSH8]|uniref:MFS transporter n=1 Tax=Pseudarthrobacter sp. NBSH8 TaxID=2596911 RepID=UPI00351B240F